MICPFPFLVIACVAAFVPQNDRPRPKVGALSFKDSSSGEDLPAIRRPSRSEHHRPSDLTTSGGSSSFPAQIPTEEWKEWQASFGRNGFTDFLPQFASHLDCLSLSIDLGDGTVDDRRPARLPWQDDEATSQITEALFTSLNEIRGASADAPSSIRNPEVHSVESVDLSITACLAQSDSQLAKGYRGEEDYDCILDSGLLNSIVAAMPSEVTWHSQAFPAGLLDLVELIHRATVHTREFGIYVALTDCPIPEYARSYLDSMGQVVGMEWTYDLDGISTKEKCVSVARKYFTGVVNFDSKGVRDNLLKP